MTALPGDPKPEKYAIGVAPGLRASLKAPGVVEAQFAVGMGGVAGAEAGAEAGAVWGSWGGPLVMIGGAVLGMGVEAAINVMMAKGGKQTVADTGVIAAYDAYMSEEKAAGRPPDDRCTWLERNAYKFRPDQVNRTKKAWGCKASTYWRGGKRRS